MATLVFDSKMFGSAWADDTFRAIFDEPAMVMDWLEILSVLAESQAHFDLIPKIAAKAIAKTCRGLVPDDEFFTEVAQGYQDSSHSTQGLIRAIIKRCPGKSGEWFFYGTTVQDVTDSWMSRANLKAHALLSGHLETCETAALDLAARHKHTPMAGRTHGQQGLPITFGFKVAGWAVEIARHRQRMAEIRPRLGHGQLCGGVGSMESLGPRAFDIQKMFFSRLGLTAPAISWTASRDVFAEWSNLLTLICGTADRIGHEVYNLQRNEIGEVSEGFIPGTVGSITMPHKRNPEIAEHLGTLSRLVRHNGALINEGLVNDHERDGRAWKAEWNALPQSMMATGKAISLLWKMVQNLKVDPERMLANLKLSKGFSLSEPLMLALAAKIGRKSAHKTVYQTAMQAQDEGMSLRQAVLCNPCFTDHLSDLEINNVFDYDAHTGRCADMVDQVFKLKDSP